MSNNNPSSTQSAAAVPHPPPSDGSGSMLFLTPEALTNNATNTTTTAMNFTNTAATTMGLSDATATTITTTTPTYTTLNILSSNNHAGGGNRNNSNATNFNATTLNANTPTIHNINNNNINNNNNSSNSGRRSNNHNTNQDDIEYYPRNKRAPYLHDISDFGIRLSPRHNSNTMGEYYEGWDTAAANNNDDPTLDGGGGGSGGGSGGAGGTSGLKNSGASTMALNSKLPSSSNLGQQIRRRSSFVSMFTSLGMSPGAGNSGNSGNNATAAVSSNVSYSAWGDSGAGGASGTAGGGGGVGGGGPIGTGMGGDEGGGGTTGANQSNLDENEMNVFLPPRFRRGSSATFIAPGGAGSTSLAMRRGSTNSIAEGPSSSSMRDRVGSVGGSMAAHNSIGRYPRWMLHDPSAIVMKDGQPIPLGMLVHHHTLLSPSQSSHPSTPYFVTPTWRLKERMKTVGVCLILALNIGTDPPDINKPNPCAKLQCWLDPTSISRAKAKERIGERLEQQYARWQQRSKLKYRRALDPTVDIVQELCFRMRETAKGERVLLHYNGHGVPRPTPNGEIWLFDKHHTNYIPFSVTDLRKWIGKPSVVVLDCSGAGVLMPFFTSALNANVENNGVGDGGNGWNIGSEALPAGGAPSLPTNSSDPNDPIRAIRDTIVLCPTAQGEWLPMNPEFPADIFTSCLTTPIPIALRWFVYQNPLSMEFIDLETIYDAIPGKIQDRKSPLGELNWIFTAITDTIAWNVLPSPLFQRLFRQDLLVSSIFRNFLLADRILRSLNCSPMSNPELPSTCHHPLWQAWDLAVETCLNQLIDEGYLRKNSGISTTVAVATTSTAALRRTSEDGEESDTSAGAHGPPTQAVAPGGMHPSPLGSNVTFNVNAPFFAEQLTAFEIWLEFASAKPRGKLVIRSPPSDIGGTPLPFLQGTLGSGDATQASHEMDPPEQLPIVLQVLLSQAHRVRALILLRRFIDLGPSAVNLALSVGIFPYVLKLLQSPIDEYKHVLVGIWATVIEFDPSCQVDVVKDRALSHFILHLRWGLAPGNGCGNLANPPRSSPNSSTAACFADASEQRTMAAFILSVICSGYTLGQSECINEKLHLACSTLLQSLESPDDIERKQADGNLTPQFRMWLCICLGNLVKDNPAAQSELYRAGLHFRLISRLDDDSSDVRAASCYALSYIIGSAPTKSEADFPPLSSMVQQQQQPQQSSMPSFQQGMGPVTGTLPGTLPMSSGMNVGLNPSMAIAPTQHGGGPMLMPTYDTRYGLQHSEFRPQLAPVLPGLSNTVPGVVNLTTGTEQARMFGIIPPASNTQIYSQPEARSVYEDAQRMYLDLSVAIKLAEITKDSSPLVRFEAALALNRFVGKYISAFVAIAGKKFGSLSQGRNVLGGNISSIPLPLPDGVSHETEMKLAQIWESIFHLHRNDPYVSVRLLVNSIVIAINERAISEKNKLQQIRVNSRRRSICRGSVPDESDDEKEADGGDFPLPSLAERRNATGVNLSTIGSPPPSLKRTGSTGTNNAFIIGTPPRALQDGISSTPVTRGSQVLFGPSDLTETVDYFCPESKLYLWKKVEFAQVHGELANAKLDPLSDSGAIKKYRSTRNQLVQQKGQLLKDSFAVLAQKPVSRAPRSPFNYDADWERGEGDAAAGVEKEIDMKKHALQLRQISLLRNSGTRTTSLLRFHPYEPALVVCGGSDTVSVWNAETSQRMTSFSNENPKSTRMTSACWVNEASTSLLLTGSNDGSVRVWDGIFEPNDEISRSKPSLVSSFFAAPDIVSDQRFSSGLVLEFQQYGGQLIAGGNTKTIRCWDIGTEKCHNTFDSKSGASLTTLTTAWNSDAKDGYSGIGPDIIVAGYGNGSLRVFDTRSRNGDPVMSMNDGGGHRNTATKRRWKCSEYDEHSNWIVDLSFTNYGGRHEVVSGCVAGKIKFWDLRYSSSVRTLDHKMQMTALAVHSNVPMFATGSPAQFIKIMSHDGVTQQVIRYHEKIAGQRIGPVSCLSFHPHMPYLAAGFADELVGLYAPNMTMN